MTVEAGTKIRIISSADDTSDYAVSEGYVSGAIGEVFAKDERLARISLDNEFVVRFDNTTAGEGFFFTFEEEGTIWERAE